LKNCFRTLEPRDLKFGRLIGHPIDIEFSGSKDKVSVALNKKNQFPINNLRTLGNRDLKLDMLLGHDRQLTPIGFEVSVTFSSKQFLINKLITNAQRNINLGTLTGHGQQMNTIEFEVSGSKVKFSVLA
jgi:hypothetical protein